MELIGLDFETYGAVNLPKHGLFRYVADPSFKVLLASTAWRGFNDTMMPHTLDFVEDHEKAVRWLEAKLDNRIIVAHNAIFERVVLSKLGLDYPAERFIDSAVVARASGAGSRLEQAAPQLLAVDKMEEGTRLMSLFSVPSKLAVGNGVRDFDPRIVVDHAIGWQLFKDYCQLDAELSLRIVEDHHLRLTTIEQQYQAITMDMNMTGWHVDLSLVKEMQRRYLANQAAALDGFRRRNLAPNLNLNSLKQMKEWCAERGVRATSFAEKPLEKLRDRLQVKLNTLLPNDPKLNGYCEVFDLLTTKQILGGSSLKKLQVILDTTNGDWDTRLHDQYVHCGAGQTLRTTGRSTQMQNLKRLSVVQNMSDLDHEGTEWDNDKLAENLRQVFTATHPQGQLVVGDFKSVESRGLAWMACEAWKVNAYRQDEDLYKLLASKIYGIPYCDVDKMQRQTGKVGELSCGYGAGPGAVVSFAEGMGVKLDEEEAARLVWNWRDANPKIVEFWTKLDEALHSAVIQHKHYQIPLPDWLRLDIAPTFTPLTLSRQSPRAISMRMVVLDSAGNRLLQRYFHGCYTHGRNIRYHKPSDRKTGDLWKQTFIDPKTKQLRHYELYGGKLAGILTQSLCRELFFESLLRTHEWVKRTGNVQLVGQFHDEIVLDWTPIRASGETSLYVTKSELQVAMTRSALAPSFPLAAEIKNDHRYTK